ncbi:MAG: hypothetical protein OIF51_14160 [Cellvibrionaceae bacterium]|nr:hypothetical protein [Cellvibrionaceae bacterium]
MSSYKLIDEPSPSLMSNLIVSPVLILLIGIFGPLLYTPPMFGRYWLPLLWFIANSFFLGSPTRLKEVAIALAGGTAILALFWAPWPNPNYFPYARILISAVLFFTMYMLSNLQSAPFELHEYLKEHER